MLVVSCVVAIYFSFAALIALMASGSIGSSCKLATSLLNSTIASTDITSAGFAPE
jgi:hypothetical protein